MHRGLLIMMVAAVLFPAAADATLVMTGDSTTRRGQVSLTVYASDELVDIRGGEIIDGEFVELTQFDLVGVGTLPEYGPLATGTAFDVARWRCDRRTRTFQAVGHDENGQALEAAEFTVRTPSCRDRLDLRVPQRVRPGAGVTAIIRDTFRQGDVDMRFCVKAPKQKARCRTLSMPEGLNAISTTFRVPRTGRYRIDLAAGQQHTERVVSVGVPPRPSDLEGLPAIVTTGDSMMQSIDSVLGDSISRRAHVISDVFISSGLTKPHIVDWTRLPARHVRSYDPQATIIWLGANETGPFYNDAGQINCCDDAWVAAYAERAREIMETYRRDGDGAVIWLTSPVPGDAARALSMAAVNRALRRAADGLERVSIVDTEEIFTPGGVYRDTIVRNGRPVRVRQDDQVHLTIAGARILAPVVIDELEALDVI